MTNPLAELGKKYGTSKMIHCYMEEVYYPLMESVRNENVKILEIGAGDTGASHLMWKEFFPNGEVTLFDPFFIVDPSVTVTESEMIEAGIKVIKGNQLRVSDLQKADPGDQKYDFIIDDASHVNDAQQISFANLFPFLKPGGYYIVEDLISARDRSSRLDDVNNWLNSEAVDSEVEKIYHTEEVHIADSAVLAAQVNLKYWPSRLLSQEQKNYILEHVESFQITSDREALIVRKKLI